jgi:hypothetical protein
LKGLLLSQERVDAGYTGCLPAENQISNVHDDLGGATWNATCKGKVFLCSGDQNTEHCTPGAEIVSFTKIRADVGSCRAVGTVAWRVRGYSNKL